MQFIRNLSTKTKILGASGVLCVSLAAIGWELERDVNEMHDRLE